MKTLLIIIFSLFVTQSCIDNKLLDLAREVIKNPETIRNLPKYYPGFYDENYIYDQWNKMENHEEIIEHIKKYVQNSADENIKFKKADLVSKEWFLKAKSKDYSFDDCYKLIFQKAEIIIVFDLIYKNGKYYIYFIAPGFDLTYIESHRENN